jgi:hypothetical protein
MFAEEISELRELAVDLEKEGRVLRDISHEEYTKKYGYYPSYVKLFVEKTHDKILTHDFMTKVAKFMEKKGSTVIDGRVTAVYTDDPAQGGYLEYMPTAAPATAAAPALAPAPVLVPFSKLVMSLGAQRIHTVSANNSCSAPILDVVCARGVVAVAIAYVPVASEGKSIPPVCLCGGVNDAVVVGGPVAMTRNIIVDGKETQQKCNAYLMKLTSGALITPNTLDKTSTHYHAATAVGLFSAVRATMECDVEAVAVWGCNRQVSQYGETHWFEAAATRPEGEGVVFNNVGSYRPLKSLDTGSSGSGIYVQLGAAGGGLTQAPAQPPTPLPAPAVWGGRA